MITIRDEIVHAMNMLGSQPDVLFVGYNVCREGGNAGGSLKDVPQDQIQEMPLAENLMLGAAIGLSLSGYVPVVWIERMDFILCGLDSIVNHLNQLAKLSDGQHKPGVIIRVCVGNRNAPLFTGPTHTQNLYEAMWRMVSFPVYLIENTKSVEPFYRWALEGARKGKSTMIIEEKDRYNE